MPHRHTFAFPDYLSSEQPAHTAQVAATVAFRDCDPMGVLWHGNYLAYCEIARNALGRELGFGITTLMNRAIFAPVVRSQVVHLGPVRAEDELTITASLYPTR